jgi:hypothetical protein
MRFLVDQRIERSPNAVPFEVISRGDLTFLPILDHGADYSKFLSRIKPFTDVVSKSDHLIIEGYSHADNAIRRQSPTTLESLAIETFRKRHSGRNIHYLEEGIKWKDLGEKYGIKGDWQPLYRYLGSYYIQLALKGRAFKPNEFVKTFVGHAPGYSSRDLEAILSLFNKTYLNFDRAINQGSVTADEISEMISRSKEVFTWYFARLRDFELICPNVIDLTNRLDGKKSMVIGSGHLPLIEKALEGETLSRPEKWPQFVDSLPMIYKNSIDTIHRMMEEPLI